jgi:siroheme synthase-like protein
VASSGGKKREFAPSDLAEAGIVFAATNVRAVNRAVAEEARQRGLLVNVADAPAEGNFHAPAVHRTDEAIIAISSYAAQPASPPACATGLGSFWDRLLDLLISQSLARIGIRRFRDWENG